MCVESAVFLLLFSGFHVLFMKSATFHEKIPRSICVYTCTNYTYKLHQIPIKYNIYIVGIPSVHMKHQVIMRDLCWIRCFCCFSVLFTKSASFHKKTWLSMKTNKIRSICVYTCTIYTYMHHLPHQIPPKCKIYLVGLPSVLYERPDQNEISVLNQLFLLFFRFFSVVFMCFSWKVQLFIQKVPLFMKTNKTSSMCVYMYHLHIHVPHAPWKYKIYLAGLPSVLYERPSQNESIALFMKSTWKATKTTDSTQISHFDLVFHRIQREGQLGSSYILMVFGGAHVCLVVHVCVYGACMHTCLVFCIIPFHHGFHKM